MPSNSNISGTSQKQSCNQHITVTGSPTMHMQRSGDLHNPMCVMHIYGCMGVWVHTISVKKCIGGLSTELQLLSLQLVLCTGMGTIAGTPVLLMRSCGIYHPIIAVPEAEMCVSLPGMCLQLSDPSIFMAWIGIHSVSILHPTINLLQCTTNMNPVSTAS